MISKITTIIAVFAITALPSLQAQEPPVKPALTLEQFMKGLIENHPIFIRTEYAPQIKKYEQVSLTGSRDWTFSTSAGLSHVSQTSSVQSSGLENSTIASLGGGVSRLFWETGGLLSAELSMADNHYNYRDDPMYSTSPVNAYENSFYFSYVQPLLQNWKGVLYNLPYKIKNVEVEQESLNAFETRESFLSNNVSYYLEWVYYLIEEDILLRRLELAQKSLEQNRNKRAKNLIDEVDVIRAENSVNSVEMILKSNRMNQKVLLDKLVVITGETSLPEKQPKFDLYQVYELPDRERLVNTFIEESRVLHVLRQTNAILEINRLMYREYLKSNLSLTIQAGLKEYDSNFGAAILINQPDVYLGLMYEFPYQKTSEKADLRAIELQTNEMEKQIEETEIDYVASISSLCDNIQEMLGILEGNRKQIELAERQTAEEMRLYQVGRNDFTFVIQSQDSEASSRLTLAQNALTYQKLYYQMLAMIDELYK